MKGTSASAQPLADYSENIEFLGPGHTEEFKRLDTSAAARLQDVDINALSTMRYQ